MVHAVGTGLRYKTPIGPLRLDLAWSINPPAFVRSTGTGRLNNFQFFFSIGQTF